MLSKGDVTHVRVRALIKECFVDRKRNTDYGYCPTTCFPSLEIEQQSGLAHEYIRDLQSSIATHVFPPALISGASDLCAKAGWSFDTLSQPRQQDVLEGLARVLVEQQKLFLFRLNDRLVPYTPVDPLFANAINCTEIVPALRPRTQQVTIGPSFAEAI